MKKLALTKLVLVLILFSSCAGEEIATKERNGFKVEKTAEMKFFEESLKEWFLSKKGTTSDIESQKRIVANHENVKKSSSDLLISIGVSPDEISKQKNTSTEALISFTLKEYSKALKELNNN